MSIWADDNRAFLRAWPWGTLPTDKCQHPHPKEWDGVNLRDSRKLRNPCPKCIAATCAIFKERGHLPITQRRAWDGRRKNRFASALGGASVESAEEDE